MPVEEKEIVKEVECETLKQFIEKCKKADVRMAKLTEYAFVEPGFVGAGSVAMIGKERLVLTAFNNGEAEKKLLRWQQTREAAGMVTTVAGTDRGFTSGSGFAEEARRIRSRLEIQGIQVVEGEWTKKELEELLNSSE